MHGRTSNRPSNWLGSTKGRVLAGAGGIGAIIFILAASSGAVSADQPFSNRPILLAANYSK